MAQKQWDDEQKYYKEWNAKYGISTVRLKFFDYAIIN
jgi:hypothetical protein